MKRFQAMWWVVCLLAGLSVSVLAASGTNLHYLVVDHSGSIRTYLLTEPLKLEVKRLVSALEEQDEVRIVLFDEERFAEKQWKRMDLDAKSDFSKHFEKHYRPADGETWLYDTVDWVLDQVQPVATNYDTIQVRIFSDGDDSMHGTIRSWDSIEEKACRLMRSHPATLINLYTIGFRPKQLPTDCIQTIYVSSNNVVIPPDPPRADFEAAPRQVLGGEEVTFFARRSPGQVEKLEWSFGDGQLAAGTLDEKDVVKHAYAKSGAYSVALVAMGEGGRDEKVRSDYIVVREKERPIAKFSWVPDQPRVGQPVVFINQSAGHPDSFRWTVGNLGSFMDVAPKVTPVAAGTQQVVLVAIKGELAHTSTASLVVLPLPPDPAFEVKPAGDVEVGQRLTLRAKADGPGIEHVWTVNGQDQRAGATLDWEAKPAGKLEIAHAVRGPGGEARQVAVVLVKAPERPDPDFDVSPQPVEVGGEVAVEAKLTRPGWVHRWIIDGRPYEGPRVVVKTDHAGAITAKHEVVFGDQVVPLEKAIAVVDVARLLPRFSASPKSGKHPLSVQFRDQTEGEVTAYQWEFGDGGTSEDRRPTHVFTAAGAYSVRLSVENKYGHRTTSAEPMLIRVKNPPPAWLWPAIVGAALAIAGFVAYLKTRPVPPGGTLQWELPEGGRSRAINVTGATFDLAAVKAPGWKSDGVYQIAVKGGKRVVLKDGAMVQELGRDKRFRAGGVAFRYMNQLLEE